jgi:hypothetical protein
MPPIGASPYDVEHVDALIARLATDQDGVVARAQLAALGLSRGATEHRLRTGRLIPLYRGVYAVGHTARKLVHDAGLPRPVVNHPVGRYVADFAWLDHRVIVGTDGYRTHGHRAAFESDHDRAAHLTAEGWVVLRFTWRRLRDEPLLVAAQLAQVLSRRSPRPRGPAAA